MPLGGGWQSGAKDRRGDGVDLQSVRWPRANVISREHKQAYFRETDAGSGAKAVAWLLLQAQAAAFGPIKAKPVFAGVSTKSIVMPSSRRRLSAGRKSLTPSCVKTASLERGSASTLNSAARPEH